MTISPSTFAIGDGNLTDMVGAQVPNFERRSPIFLESMVEGSLQLDAVPANQPAIDNETGAFYGEPAAINVITYSQSLGNAAWIKGSNVIVREDYIGQGRSAPDGTQTADRITFSPGTGLSQKITRSFNLQAQTEYTLSVVVMLQGGLFGGNDAISMTGGVVGTPTISLSQLNPYPDRWQILSITFQTDGTQPNYPASPHELGAPSITAVANNQLTISIPTQYAVNSGDWVGGQAVINGATYTISYNSASSSGSVTLELLNTTLSSVGIVVGQKVALIEAAPQQCNLEIYCENVVAIGWGGVQLEKGSIRTSFIPQSKLVAVRAGTLLSYRKSPIADLTTFSVYAECKFWRGDGGLFSFGNLTASIVNGKLVVTANNAQINLTEVLPPSFKLFIQVTQSNASLSIYLDGILKARTTVSNFRGATSQFSILFDAVRSWQRFMVKTVPLIEGQIDVGQPATAEVADLFVNPVPIDATTISRPITTLILPPVTIPPPTPPITSQQITAIAGANSQTLTVADATVYPAGVPVLIKRGNDIIMRTRVESASGTTVTVGSGAGSLIGDYLVYGNEVPGRANVRFPNEPIDPQVISAINPGSKQVTVSSALSFVATRALVRDVNYQDVGQFLVQTIDTVNGLLTLDTVSGLSVGQTIYQVSTELLLSPDTYLDLILEGPPGVSIIKRFTDGCVIENTNPDYVTVTLAIRVCI